MACPYIAHKRLYNQYISRPIFDSPADVVAWLGAVQAQDYLGALWAIGLRARDTTEKTIESAIADKAIVRTWPMRRTLHFVAAADIRWMLELLTPRIVAGNARRVQQHFGLDEDAFARCKELFASALEGGIQLTRGAMYKVLEAAGISTAGGRGLHILSRLSQDGFICFGARQGKQPTFALLHEWVPNAKTLARDEALAELARRYFTSHGPATLKDFVWWSGLTTTDARAGLEMARTHLAQEVIEDKTYWFSSSTATAAKDVSPTAYLLPPFDEYTVAYKDRSSVLDPSYAKRVNPGNGVFSPAIVIDGQIVGTWKRTFKRGSLIITPSPFGKFNKAETKALATAASRYGEFLESSIVLQ